MVTLGRSDLLNGQENSCIQGQVHDQTIGTPVIEIFSSINKQDHQFSISQGVYVKMTLTHAYQQGAYSL